MARAGKIYPYTRFQDFTRQAGSTAIDFICPRKLHLVNNGSAVGTLGLLWQGLELISEVVERTNDPGLLWKIVHPGDADSYILIFGTIVSVDPTSWPGPSNVNFLGEREFWHHGLRYGRGSVSVTNTNGFTAYPGSWCGAVGNWQNLLDPSQFQRMGDNTRIGSAVWADDPAYQPYRTRP